MRFVYFRILAVLTYFSVASSLSADDSYLTRFSELQFVDSYEEYFLVLTSNGREVSGTRCEHCKFLHLETGIYRREDADIVVLIRGDGGSSCPVSFQFVLVQKNGEPRASKSSDTCSDIIRAIRVSHAAIELDIEPFKEPNLSQITLRYDGTTMEEIEVPRNDPDFRVAGAGEDVTRWVGEHMYSILDDPTERQRFAKIMPPEVLHDLVYTTYGMSGCSMPSERLPFFTNGIIVDGFLIADSCHFHFDRYGFIAIEVATGKPYALVHDWFYVFGGEHTEKEKEYLEGCKDCRLWGPLGEDIESFQVYGRLEVYGATLEKLPIPLRKITGELLN